MQQDEDDTVKTFSDYTERWWTAYMLLVDIVIQLYREVQAAWKSIWSELPWIDEDDLRRVQRDEDRSLYAAA